ncbi:MAG TPA: hypothetical protein VGB22_06610 [candidate division Zixibacteria bacterium]|jgi:hypothetical protein
MAFTSPELVRRHLTQLRVGEAAISDFAVTLDGIEAIGLAHGGLVSGSVIVKALRPPSLIRETVTLASDWVNLSHQRLIPDAVVVAADSSLGTVYSENTDFIVDYDDGRIKRLAAGSIVSPQTVTVWYEYYHQYVEGDDYAISLTTGELSRRSTGAIADGQRVLVDYLVALGTVSDEVIDTAISDVGDAVLAMIDPQYRDVPTPGIVIGETHWAVAAVCRMRAVATLADAGLLSSQSRAVSQTWMEIAAQYEESGRVRLSRFAAPVSGLQSGRRT